VPKTWNEGFDFYLTHLEEDPASILVDLTAALHAPLASHPKRLIIRVKMKEPQANGLRSSGEADALFRVEDAITDALAGVDALFVGRVVTGGNTDHFFYLPGQTSPASLTAAVKEAAGDYATELGLRDDPEWTGYFQFLFPDHEQQQLMSNRRVLEQLANNGDRHDQPRQVDHLVYFPDLASASKLAEQLVVRGFRVDPPRPPEPGGDRQMWALEFHRVEAVTPEQVDALTLELLRLLEGTGGHYDGWGCVVVKESVRH